MERENRRMQRISTLHYAAITDQAPRCNPSAMRLNKIKLAGFKSFVDPTAVNFPSNLIGVVGPNGCGKSNIIDAVRWVMGEISAKHLRGDSMADVVFNGSSSRKPVGTASVELVFDNSDGQLAGQYAGYYGGLAEARRVARRHSRPTSSTARAAAARTSRSCSSAPGSGSRSYAIIEQGMISRIIEARARRAARLRRGSGRHLQVQGAPPRDREPHRAHQGEPRAPDRRARGSRQAAAPPAAPGRHGAPLPDPEAGRAQADRRSCWRCACA